MITKPPLQKILQGILHTESETQHNHERAGNTKPQEKKREESRVTLIQLHTITGWKKIYQAYVPKNRQE
jgi:hypothetical protein